jgi:hypothetical protein
VLQIGFSPAGAVLAIADADGVVGLFDVSTLTAIGEVHHPQR